MVVQWHDNAIVTIATNFDAVQPVGSINRRGKGVKISVPQPHMVGQYNKYMGGVDLFDQNVSCYRIGIRSKKWYWPQFTHGLNAAMSNAWLVYRTMSPNCSQLDFIRSIVTSYLIRAGNEKELRPTTTRLPTSIRFDNVGHFVASRSTQRRCQNQSCSARPRTYCIKCDATLCVNCFLPYHKKN